MEAAKQLFFQYGLKKTTVDEIARDARVGKGTIYLYFKTKEELLSAISAKLFDELIEELRAKVYQVVGVKDRLRVYIMTYFIELFNSTKAYPHSQDLASLYDECAAKGECCSFSSLLNDILVDAKNGGELNEVIGNTEIFAESIVFQLGAFMPPYKGWLTLEELQRELELYLDMVIKYIKA